MDTQFLVDQLAQKLRATALLAVQAHASAVVEAREGASPAEKREDARVALESGGLARGQSQRAERAKAELAVLDTFHPRKLPRGARVELGAVVEVEGEEGGRTFFLAPVGAGEELTGPGGDGFLSVVTPASPVGRAVIGRKEGDTIEVIVNGESLEWTLTFVA